MGNWDAFSSYGDTSNNDQTGTKWNSSRVPSSATNLPNLCRALLAWTPGYLYILMAAQQGNLLTPVGRAIPIIAMIAPVSLPTFGAPAIGLGALIVGAVYAASRPARGIQDWLTGTWLVPGEVTRARR